MRIIGTTLNAKYIHTNLALRYLKAYAAPEYNVEIIEYTIKDPVMNIVTDLYNQKPDVIGFSCYIWNMEEIKKVITILKKINPNIEKNIFNSIHAANIDTLPGYKIHNEEHTFLDYYDE